jgi:hypothetical protein
MKGRRRSARGGPARTCRCARTWRMVARWQQVLRVFHAPSASVQQSEGACGRSSRPITACSASYPAVFVNGRSRAAGCRVRAWARDARGRGAAGHTCPGSAKLRCRSTDRGGGAHRRQSRARGVLAFECKPHQRCTACNNNEPATTAGGSAVRQCMRARTPLQRGRAPACMCMWQYRRAALRCGQRAGNGGRPAKWGRRKVSTQGPGLALRCCPADGRR